MVQEQLLLRVALVALGLVEALLPLHVVAYLAGSLVYSHSAHLIGLEVLQINLSRCIHQMLLEIFVEAEIDSHGTVLITFLCEPLLHLLVIILLIAVFHVFAHLLVGHLLCRPEGKLVALGRSLGHVDRALIHRVRVPAHYAALGVRCSEHPAVGLLIAARNPRV